MGRGEGPGGGAGWETPKKRRLSKKKPPKFKIFPKKLIKNVKILKKNPKNSQKILKKKGKKGEKKRVGEGIVPQIPKK